MFSIIKQIILRELLVSIRDKSSWFAPICFYLLTLSLFPLSISVNAKQLSELAPGIIWVSYLFAQFLSLNRMFITDYQDGVLDQWLCSSKSSQVYCLTKLISHWLIITIPLFVITPITGLFFHLELFQVLILMLTLLLGGWIISAIGSITVALLIAVEDRGFLLAILTMPLYVPVLILGTMTTLAASNALPISGYLALLLAFALGISVLQPWAASAALRITSS